MAKSKKVILPMKMSALLKIALRDLRKAERQPKKFIIDMQTWFYPERVECATAHGHVVETHDVCTVCAAGSVMAFSLNANIHDFTRDFEPEDFVGNVKQLRAIDDLRCGQILGAAQELGLVNYDGFGNPTDPEFVNKIVNFDCDIPDYNMTKPEPFHRAMEKLEAKLKKAGL